MNNSENYEDMLEFQNEAFLELFQEDGLLIMAKGLGLEFIFANLMKIYCDTGNLVIVVGLNSMEEKFMSDVLAAKSVTHLPKSMKADCSINERKTIYMKGGVFTFTSRILVVDMLMNRIPFELVTGILVYKAHRVLESSQEAFIMRLYREKNKQGFIKAVSDSPISFTRGFCQVERIMRNLFLKKLYLWPRFRVSVNTNLEAHKSQVEEYQMKLSPDMDAIQTNLVELITVCVKEIQKCNPMVDTEDITVENVISKAFDKIIKMQLDPIWHQLSSKTKLLINDLKALRHLLMRLTQCDCITFYHMVEEIKTSEKAKSNVGWLFMDAADHLFVRTRSRVFGPQDKLKDFKDANEEGGKSKRKKVTPKLDGNPKWEAVNGILEEIRKEIAGNQVPAHFNHVLIVAGDDRTCRQLHKVLSKGEHVLLSDLYEKFIASYDPNVKLSASEDVELEDNEETISLCDVVLTQPVNSENESKPVALDVDQSNSEYSPTIVIKPLKDRVDPFSIQRTLQRIKPRFIIMYDTDIAFVRQVEVFKAAYPEIPLKVYLLVYVNSAEEQSYLNSMRRDKDAFETLIKQKAGMVIPEERDGLSGDHPDLIRDPRKANETVNPIDTRRGGASNVVPVQQKIIVDMREFRSDLPSLIHRRGINVEPMTLEVGDYILTPDICVERKSISDLIGSLNSGRLFNQATAMCRHYTKPVLLIEFSQEKPFVLQGKSNSSNDITSKLVLLTMHFPRLKILWCSSPYATAELFEELKAGKEQPDAAVTNSITAAVTSDVGTECRVDKYNPIQRDFVHLLPGIDSKNLHAVLNHGKSISHLSTLSQEELNEILDNTENAKQLWESFHLSQTPSASTSNAKMTGARQQRRRKR